MELKRRSFLYDIWLADNTLLQQIEPIQTMLSEAVRASGATILATKFHQFTPQGVTGFFLLAESHVSIHTWPEEGLASIDIFTCGHMQPEVIVEQIRQQVLIQREQLRELERG